MRIFEEQITFGIPYEIHEGVYLLRMPMPFRLDHINLYILENHSGWTLIDCGLNTEDTISLWEQLFNGFLAKKPVEKILVTHLHPDHIGLASWLQNKSGAPVFMTRGEWEMAEAVFELPLEAPEQIHSFYKKLGAANEKLGALEKQASAYRKLVKQLPDSIKYLRNGDILQLGGREWEIKVGHGHSPECACLWWAEGHMLIAGDHILPTISPNISVFSIGPSNPLQDYLDSLAQFQHFSCDLLLPAHGLPGSDYDSRIKELIDHHKTQLASLESFCNEPRTPFECVPYLFRPDLPDHQFYFAIGEATAHLVYLAGQGRLRQVGESAWSFTKN